MGAAATKTVDLVIRADAHVDEAYTNAGFVSKLDALSVPESDAKKLLERHPYLTTRKA